MTSASLMVRPPGSRTRRGVCARTSGTERRIAFRRSRVALARKGMEAWHTNWSTSRTREPFALEFERQLAIFERLLGRAPTHLDSHQHVHLKEPARSILLQYAEKLGVPLRNCTPAISYQGSFYGQTDEAESFPAGISTETLVSGDPAVTTWMDRDWLPSGIYPRFGLGLFARAGGRDSNADQCDNSPCAQSNRSATAIFPRLQALRRSAPQR